jgi:hypothetical protein
MKDRPKNMLHSARFEGSKFSSSLDVAPVPDLGGVIRQHSYPGEFPQKVVEDILDDNGMVPGLSASINTGVRQREMAMLSASNPLHRLL